MPSLNNYKKFLNGIQTSGEAKKVNSDMIMESTWYEDPASMQIYLFDYYHDEEPLKYYNIHPYKWKNKTLVDVKFIVNAYKSESKDITGKHIMFKPSFRWENEKSLSYYKDNYVDRFESEFPIGLYCAIKDEKGIYRKWLITEIATSLDLQFPTWYILPCDHLFQWVHEGKKYQICGVSRNQNSYNSGLWTSRGGVVQTTTPENQLLCIMPMNDVSITMFYDQRIVISAPIKTPIVWECSKVNNMSPKGIVHFTFAQKRWNEHTDVFEYLGDEENEITNIYYPDKKIVGIWADYYSSTNPIELDNKTKEDKVINKEYKITYSGVKPDIKSGGSYKKFTVNFFTDGLETKYIPGRWEYTIDGKPCDDLIDKLTTDTSNDVNENQEKIKFKKNDLYIGKVIKVNFIPDNFAYIGNSIDIEIKGL